MNQNIFETGQRANELLAEAVKLWKRSDQSEYLEGLDTDPVFKLLINALAYQTNELESEIESLKDDILDEFEKVMSRGEGCRAVPALTVVSAPLTEGVSEIVVNSADNFILDGVNHAKFGFTSLFRTRLINANVKRVSRIDSYQWSVTIEFPYMVNNLSGFSFSIDDFHHVGLSVRSADQKQEFPIISPLDYACYPMADFFSMETVLFNRSQAVNTGSIRSGMSPYSNYMAVDLFCRSMVGFYMFGEMPDFEPTRQVNLVFSFNGIPEDFVFGIKNLKVNVLILINAHKSSVNISSENPIMRLTDESSGGRAEPQFLGLLPSKEENNGTQVPIQVRRIGMERFNQGRLVSLLQNLIVKFNSDYYAFESIGSKTTDAVMRQIQKNLSELIHIAKSKIGLIVPGTYVYLDYHKYDSKYSVSNIKEKNTSIRVDILLTEGSQVNGSLKSNGGFQSPPGIDSDKMRCIIDPVPGVDEILDKKTEAEMSRYFISTEDRIITPFDVKVFCYTELKTHYGIGSEMVKNISVLRRQTMVGGYRTYALSVTITMKPNEFVRRAFEGKTEIVELYMSRMIWARTTGAYPVILKLIIGNN